MGGAAVADGLVAAASFVRWYGRGWTKCFFFSQSYLLSFHVGNSSSSFKTHSCITSWTKSSLTLSSLSISFPPSLSCSCIPSFIHVLMNIHWARPAGSTGYGDELDKCLPQEAHVLSGLDWHTKRDAHPTCSGSRALQVQLNSLINLWAQFYVIFKTCENHSGNRDLIQIRKADSRTFW